MSSLKEKILSGFLWSIFGKVGYILVAFVGNLILARLLTPVEFGQVGIIMFFVIIAKVLTESGLSGAIVRKPEVEKVDYSTVFIFNLLVSIVLFVVYVISAKYIAEYYEDEIIQDLLIITSSILIINAFQIVQITKLVRDLKFKKISIYNFFSVLVATSVGCILAYLGFGVWAIVSVNILTSLLLTLFLWIFEGGVGKLIFSTKSFKGLYKFGGNTTLAVIINDVFDNIYQLILGKYFSISQTGFYYQAKRLQEAPVSLIQSTTLGVVFSSLSKIQENREIFDAYYKRILTTFTVLTGLITLVVFIYAENLILFLYGVKWLDAVFFLKILIVASFFYMQEMFNRVIFKVFDQTAKILYLEIVKKIIQSLSIIIGISYLSLELLMYGFLISSIISYFINNYYVQKVFKFSSFKENRMLLLVIFCSITSILFYFFIIYFFEIDGYYTFILLPFLLILYSILLSVLGVMNVLSEAKSFYILFRKN